MAAISRDACPLSFMLFGSKPTLRQAAREMPQAFICQAAQTHRLLDANKGDGNQIEKCPPTLFPKLPKPTTHDGSYIERCKSTLIYAV